MQHTFKLNACTQAVFIAYSVLIGSAIANQEKILPEVRVSAQGEQAPLSLTAPGMDVAKERIKTTPGGVDLIDAEIYKASRTSTLQDALSGSPGVFVQSRFGAEESRISIRGSGIQRTFHGRGIKLMQDGIPVNLTDGSFDFQAMEPLAARYVEVWRGANALQYGASTLGGAINFVSPTGYDGERFRARQEVGSFDYRRSFASASGVAGPVDAYAAVGTFSQDGYREHARQETYRFLGNVGWRVNENTETRFYLGHFKSNSELPGSLTKAQLDNNPRQANSTSVSGNQKRDIELNRIANKTTIRLSSESRIELSAFHSSKNLFHPIFQVIDQNNNDNGVEFRFVTTASLAGNRNQFTFGVMPTWGKTDNRQWQNLSGRRGTLQRSDIQDSKNLDVYFENQHHVTDQWVFVAGAQAVRATRKLDVTYTASSDKGFDRDYQGINPKLGVRYDLSPTAQIFGNLSRSYEPPSFGEMSTTLTNVTANLKAQRGQTAEIGTRGHSRDFAWDATFYRAQLKDELLSYNLGGSQTATINAPKTRHQGIELSAAWRVLPELELRETYMWNDFRFDNDPTYGNNRLAGLPVHFSRTEITWRNPHGYYIAANLDWSPQRYAVDLKNTLFADSYAIWGVKAGRQLEKDISWFIEGRNLSNRPYAASTGVIIDAAGKDQAQFAPGDGRSFFTGIEIKM
ncbi:TonB-dependent receptor [Dechloromonas sp. ZS-1]|uniref:TonB-dependent receptor family protein n=1 Tax=Dechloromonas sp. ZS-1 TaxID=3138067 RepID=UPI0031FC7F75